MNVDAASETIPDGWKNVAVGDVCKVVSGSTPKTNVSEYWNGDIPWLTPNDLSKNRSKVVVHGERSITQKGFDSCSTQMVPEGSVLFTSRAPIGYVAIAGAPMCTNQGFKTAVPSEEIGSEFLYWQLQNLTDDIRSRASGTTFLEISGRGFAATNLVVPPLSEQEKIVETLEEQLSRLDAALASVRAVREKSERFRRSLLHAAFTGALTGHCLTSEVFPVGWSQHVLGDVVSLKSGFAYKSQDWVEDGVAVIKIANVRHGKVTLDGCSYVTDEVASETADFEVLDGHLLMTLTGEIGAIGIYKEHRPARLNQRVARIDLKLKGEHFFRYLCLFLESPHARELMWSKAQGMAQPNISPKEVLQIPFPLAPSDEQVKIVEILDEQLSRLDAALATSDVIEEKILSLRRSLLHAAFTGNLTKEWREGSRV